MRGEEDESIRMQRALVGHCTLWSTDNKLVVYTFSRGVEEVLEDSYP